MVIIMTGKRTKDISNQRFGSLVAIEFSKIENRMAYWKYQCDCGNIHIARANTVTYQSKKKNDPELPSCGCVELARKTKHGFRKATDTHPAYKAYRGIMNRCYNSNTPGYEWYGKRGVTICDEWKNNPEKFVQWSIANGWKEGLHIDKDILCKEKGIYPHVYSPETCQWVSPRTNIAFATNRGNYGKHPNIKLSHTEVAEILTKYRSLNSISMSELAREYGVTPSSISRLVLISEGSV